MEKRILIVSILLMMMGLSSCATLSIPFFSQSSSTSTKMANGKNQTGLWQGNPQEIWAKLQPLSTKRLAQWQSRTMNPEQSAWIQLALISKQKATSTSALAQQLIAWRERNPQHPANALLPDAATLNQLQQNASPKQIAILLPQQGSYASAGQKVREGFLNSYYANQANTQGQNVKFYDTSSGNIANVYQQAITEGADFVVGPLLKEDVQTLSHNGVSTTVLALNYTDNSLPNHFYEFGLLPEDEVGQMVTRAREAGLHKAIIIAPENKWGRRLTDAFANQWQHQGGSVVESWYFKSRPDFNKEVARLMHINPDADKKLMSKDNNKDTLAQQRRQDFDVIFIFAQSSDARVIVPLLRYYYVTDTPIYASSSVYSGRPNPTSDVDLMGVVICDIPWNMQAANNDLSLSRLYAVGQDAYMLSQSMNRLIQLPNFPIYGKTGALVLTKQQQIHRRVPCVAIQAGF